MEGTFTGPTLSLDQFKALTFKVIDGIDRRERLTQKELERIIGMTLSPNARAPEIRFISGNGDEGWWRWNVNIVTYTPDDTRLEMLAWPKKVDDLKNSPKCTIDYPEFHSRMKRMGFRDREGFGPLGKGTEWEYTRARQSVTVRFYYTGEPFAIEGRCISDIRMSFSMTWEELMHGRQG